MNTLAVRSQVKVPDSVNSIWVTSDCFTSRARWEGLKSWNLDDSGLLQGATFRLRRMCDGQPIVLRSRTGATWSK